MDNLEMILFLNLIFLKKECLYAIMGCKNIIPLIYYTNILLINTLSLKYISNIGVFSRLARPQRIRFCSSFKYVDKRIKLSET